MERIFRPLGGPKYDGKYLHRIVREKLGENRLRSTLTNVVIPTFDIKHLQPTIFSSYEVYLFLSLLLSRIVSYVSACEEIMSTPISLFLSAERTNEFFHW